MTGQLDQVLTRYSLTPATLYRMKLDFFRFYDTFPNQFTNTFVTTILRYYLEYRRDENCEAFEKEMLDVLSRNRNRNIEREEPKPNTVTISKHLDECISTFSFYDMVVENKRVFVEYILESYFQLSLSRREKIFFYDTYHQIKKCIQDRHIIRITVEDKDNNILDIEYQPYFLEIDENSQFYYLCGLSRIYNTDSEYSIYTTKLQRIKKCFDTKCLFEIVSNQEYEMKKRIARFGIAHVNKHESEKIKIALTDNGYNKFSKEIIHQRPLPTKIEKADDPAYSYILTFQCSSFQIKNYFFQFGVDVQVLEPSVLRDEFAEKYREAAQLYNPE